MLRQSSRAFRNVMIHNSQPPLPDLSLHNSDSLCWLCLPVVLILAIVTVRTKRRDKFVCAQGCDTCGL